MCEALSAREYQVLVEQAPIMIWRSDVTAKCDYFNDRWLLFRGRTMGQELGDQWIEGVHPKDLQGCLDTYQGSFHRREVFEMHYRLRRADGVYRWIFDRGVPFYGDDGEFLGYIGSCIDVTDRVEAQRAADEAKERELAKYRELQERDAKIRRLIDANIIIGVVISGPEGQIIEVNDVFLDMVGYSRHDLVTGRVRWSELTPAEWQAASQRAVAQIRSTGSCEVFESEYVRKDGNRVPVLVAGAAFDEARTEAVSFVLNLTERKRAENERERLRQMEADLAHIHRATTMGELTVSLAHELGEPIGAAVMNAEACLGWLTRDAPDLDEAREAAMSAVEDGTRAGDIINRIRSLYQRGDPRREPVDVNAVAREMLTLLRNQANQHSISMRVDLAANLPKVMADRVQLQQVFMNLMLNGIEAMQETRGELVVTSQQGQNGHVLVSIRDSGVGLPGEQAGDIFSAFFTTKPQGTGMGLAISRSIIMSHGGRLWAAANAERGATFHFTLPCDERC